jgi:hypothetical protein
MKSPQEFNLRLRLFNFLENEINKPGINAIKHFWHNLSLGVIF